MKYIDADKLKTWLENEADMEFKKTEENANSPVLCHFHNGCRMQALDTIDFITSLQQERPSLPSNLDEAAERRMTKQKCLKILRERLTKARTNLDKDYGYYHGIEVGLQQALEIIGMLPKLPESNELERAAEEYEDWAESYSQSDFPTCISFGQSFKAGAEWREHQMEMPDSTKLLSEWKEVKSILKERDLRNDEWRLAYQAFLFGFTRGLNTIKSNE